MDEKDWFRKDAPVYYCLGCGVPFHWSDVGYFDEEDRYVLDEDPEKILCDSCAEKRVKRELKKYL